MTNTSKGVARVAKSEVELACIFFKDPQPVEVPTTLDQVKFIAEKTTFYEWTSTRAELTGIIISSEQFARLDKAKQEEYKTFLIDAQVLGEFMHSLKYISYPEDDPAHFQKLMKLIKR